MKDSVAEEAQAWLLLNALPNLGGKRCQLLVDRFGSARAALAADRRAWTELIGESVSDQATVTPELRGWAASQWHALQRLEGRLSTLADPDYPSLLRQISSPPAVIYMLGKTALDIACVAIVGPRKASRYGLEIAGRLAHDLTMAGVCIVSGLAAGVDTAAHQAALAAGGPTIAVLGCGADVIYPAQNTALYRKIRQQGLIISEFPLGARPEAGSFPRRNRIISGLSLGVVVVEAPEKSGSLITAACATEQNREVFAVPGEVLSGRNTGCHRLLRDGARIVETADDILSELQHWGIDQQRLVQQPAPSTPLSARELQVLENLGPEPCHIDQLTQTAKLPAAELLRVLLELELNGLATQLPGKQVVRTGA